MAENTDTHEATASPTKATRKVFIISVGSSIVAAVIFSFLLEPMSQWVWGLTTEGANNWIREVQEKAIKNAALGSRNWVSALIFILGFVSILGLFIGTAASVVMKLLSKKFLTPQEEDDRETLDTKIKRTTGFVTCIFLVWFISVIMFVRHFGELSFLIYTDLQMNASFEQRMNAIRPYITDSQSYHLRSKWALMNDREDYEDIHSQIQSHAEKEGLELPELLYE